MLPQHSSIVQRLAELTTEEQALCALDWREPHEIARLHQIARERERLLNAKRGQSPPTLVEAARPIPPPDHPPKARQRPYVDRRLPPRDLPKGVERLGSGRVRAICYMRDAAKLSLGTFDPTDAGIALAGQVAKVARETRDAGGSPGAVLAAVAAVIQQEVCHAPAAD